MKKELHFFTFFMIGTSASYWAIFSNDFIIPLLWLFVLLTLVSVFNLQEIRRFFSRFLKFGLALLIFSMLHLVFRREGVVLVSLSNFPIIYRNGFHEALLLWFRFLNILALSSLFARMSPFKFILFCQKIYIPLNFSLLLLTTLRIFPFILTEVKNGVWFLRFRGILIESLSFRDKMKAGKQLLYSLILRSLQFGSQTALALELRGYGGSSKGKIIQKYQLQLIDYFILGIVLAFNLWILII